MPPSTSSATSPTATKFRASKKQNTLSILLAESAVFVRTNDPTGRNRHGESHTSIVRGLLVLEVVKPMKISAIELELIAKSATAWPEGVGAHRTDITEVHRVFEARDVAWSAPGYTGWKTTSGRGKKAHDQIQFETVEEEDGRDEERLPTYADAHNNRDSTTRHSLEDSTPPVTPSSASIAPSSFSSTRGSMSTTSTSATSAFTISPSTSAASTGSLLSNVKPFEGGLPRTQSSSTSAVQSHPYSSTVAGTQASPSATISRPPQSDEVPGHVHDNNAEIVYPTPVVPKPIESNAPRPNGNPLHTADTSTPDENYISTSPLTPNRPRVTDTSFHSQPATSSRQHSELSTGAVSRGRSETTTTRKRSFSFSELVSSLFGGKRKKKKDKGKGREVDPQAQLQIGTGHATTVEREPSTATRGGRRVVGHSRSRMSIKSSGGATVGSEETVRPKPSRASSLLRRKRRSKQHTSIPPLPPPPTTPPPVPTSASSIRTVPAPLKQTTVSSPVFSSVTNLPSPSSSSYVSHPYSSSHSSSANARSPAVASSSSTQYPSPSSSSIVPTSPKRGSFISFGDIGLLRDREGVRRTGKERESEVVSVDGAVTEDAPLPDEQGWKEFQKGTYTFPIAFRIPGHAPPTLETTYGSVTWRIKGTVRRYGTFASNLTTTSPLLVISDPAPLHYPSSGSSDPFYGPLDENILVERHWEDQLHYSINVSGRSFHVGPGATIGVDFTFVPLCRGVRVWRVSVGVEEKTEYLTQFRRIARTDPVYTVPLLALRDPHTSSKDQKWILPIPEGVHIEESPLREVLGEQPEPFELILESLDTIPDTVAPGSDNVKPTSDGDEAEAEIVEAPQAEPIEPHPDTKIPLSQPTLQRQHPTFLRRQRDETIQSLQSPYGPWSFHADLPLPSSCRVLRASNRNRRSNINVTHVLKCTVRVERGEDEEEGDDLSGGKPKERKEKKRKLFDIVIQTPVQILNCRCSPEYVYLPTYTPDEALEELDPGLSMLCPCQRNAGSVRSLGRSGSLTGSTWSGKGNLNNDKASSIGSVMTGGRSYHDKRSSISSFGSIGSTPATPIPPVPPLPAGIQPSNKRASLTFSLASVASVASTTAFSSMSSPSITLGDTLWERNKQLERLVSGSEREDGGMVPVYLDADVV